MVTTGLKGSDALALRESWHLGQDLVDDVAKGIDPVRRVPEIEREELADIRLVQLDAVGPTLSKTRDDTVRGCGYCV